MLKKLIKTEAQELSIANPRPQTFHRTWRSKTRLLVTPAMSPLIDKNPTAIIIARHQTIVKNRHQFIVQGDTWDYLY